MEKYWDRRKQEYVIGKKPFLIKFQNWWDNVDWDHVFLAGVFIFLVLVFAGAIGFAIYKNSAFYCKNVSEGLGIINFKYIFPHCYVNIENSWFLLEEYLKAINIH